MFISIFKLALVALVIAVVWSLLKPARRMAAPSRGPGRTGRESVEELVKCARCGTYVPAVGAKPCDRAGCPQI